MNDTIKNFHVDGLICPPCSPFLENGDVNYPIIDKYVQHLVDFGILNVFLTGTTGEGNSLTVEERKKSLEAWIAAGKGRLSKIIVHIGTGNLRESQDLARHAEKVGADAIACVSPTYYKPQTVDDYVNYMKEVAQVAPTLPFYLYDINFITGIQFTMDDFFTLAKTRIPTLRGLKHTSPIYPSMNAIRIFHSEYEIFLGTDQSFLEGLAIGIEVTICNSYMGHVLNRLKAAFDRGDLAEARLEQSRAVKISKIRKKYGLSIPGGTKVILKILGLDLGQPRLPLGSVSDTTIEAVKKDLTDIGFFEWALKK